MIRRFFIKSTREYVKLQIDTLPDDLAEKKGEFVTIVYHGSKEKNLIPIVNGGREGNDFGKGFYCTFDPELAKEWAVAEYTEGNYSFLYSYQIDLSLLNIFEFSDIKKWLAEVLYNNKTLDKLRKDQNEDLNNFLLKHHNIITDCDAIIGNRADDYLYRYLRDFVRGNLDFNSIQKILENNYLGEQICFKSENAIQLINNGAIKPIQLTKEEQINYYSSYKEKFNNFANEYDNLIILPREKRKYIFDL